MPRLWFESVKYGNVTHVVYANVNQDARGRNHATLYWPGMILFATILLGVSVAGLTLLFVVKYWEEKRSRVFVPMLRLSADREAIELKRLLDRGEDEFYKLGPTTIRLARLLLHDLALALARLSRASERQAHRLADMVSHKHRFERRESTNEFLKQVSEYKNGKNGDSNSLDS